MDRKAGQGVLLGSLANLDSPTIKGVFVLSHVRAVRKAKGTAGVAELERRYGQPLRYRAAEDVAVRDEVRLIEHALDILHDDKVPKAERAFEAGRLHFRNFKTTPWAKVLFTIFPRNYKFMLLHAGTIAERVFNGITFEATEVEPTHLRLVMGHADYPLAHFCGLFQEWLDDFGYHGVVMASEIGPRTYQYDIRWSGSP